MRRPTRALAPATSALFLAALLGPRVALAVEGSWVSLASLPDPRQEVGVAVLDGRIYVAGGLPRSDALQEYDAATDTWRQRARLPIAVDHPAMAAVAGRIYVIGGYTDSGDSAAVYEYDRAGDRWTQRTSMPTARGAPAAAVIAGRIYVVGGTSATQRDLEAYDPATDSWTRLPPMPTGRNHLAAGALQGRLYAAGGRPGNLGVLEVFDPATNLWTTRAPMPTPRSGHAGAVVSDRLYTFGGEGNPASPIGIFREAEVYDPVTDSWRSLDPMPTPRHGVGAAANGNRLYVPAGATQAGGGTQTGAHEAFVVQPERLHFAHFAAGQGMASEILVVNRSDGSSGLVTLELFDQSGRPLEADLGGTARSRVSLTIAPLAAATLRSREGGAASTVGSVLLSSEVPASGTILFTSAIPGFRGTAGVAASPAVTRFVVPVQRDTAQGVASGLAVATAGDAAASVTLTLRGPSGAPLATASVSLPARGQIARFLEQIFPSANFGTGPFQGTVTGESTAPLAATALLFTGVEFAALPVAAY
jgi:N-acetylneuraminic acid mutarotase